MTAIKIPEDVKELNSKIAELNREAGHLKDILIKRVSALIENHYPGTTCKYDGWSRSLRVKHSDYQEQSRIAFELWGGEIENIIMIGEGSPIMGKE